MLLSRVELPPQKRKQLIASCFDIIGCIQHVHNTLGPAMVEYFYQEALYRYLLKKGYDVKREYSHHPTFDGEALESCIKMDLVIFRDEGTVIIECKSISAISDREQLQTFGYLCGTGFPIAVLVNFGTYPKAQVERYYYENDVICAF